MRVQSADAEQGYAIAVRGLHWYFCEFEGGPRLGSLVLPNMSHYDLLPSELAKLLNLVEDASLTEKHMLVFLHLERKDCPVLVSPLFASVIAERFINGDGEKEAQTLLDAALDRFPQDVRLRQLQGLLWSRMGQLEKACDWLEKIESPDAALDEEIQGILAGAYKRRAKAEPDHRQHWLQQSFNKYHLGWRQSGQQNTYLGINAAAMALWLARSDQTRIIATDVRDLLDARREALKRAKLQGNQSLNLWDQLTLAEAHLLLEEWQKAERGYEEARQRFPGHVKAHEVARGQAESNLEAMGKSDLKNLVFTDA